MRECSPCGNTKNSILNLYNNVNGVGILNFNNFTVSTLRLCNDEHVISISGSSHTTNVSGEGGSIVSIDSNSSRRIADVTISIRDRNRPHLKEMARFLCADCCKHIKQENTYDVAFIDYQTKELFPIKENKVEFFILYHFEKCNGFATLGIIINTCCIKIKYLSVHNFFR